MAKINVPQPGGGEIVLFDGGDRTVYKIKDGVIDVPDNHVTGILAGVPGSALIPPPEAPAESKKPNSGKE